MVSELKMNTLQNKLFFLEFIDNNKIHIKATLDKWYQFNSSNASITRIKISRFPYFKTETNILVTCLFKLQLDVSFFMQSPQPITLPAPLPNNPKRKTSFSSDKDGGITGNACTEINHNKHKTEAVRTQHVLAIFFFLNPYINYE